MATIYNEAMAGKRSWLGDGLVLFDAEGVAVGVVKRNGRKCDPPAPLNDTQFDHARRAAEFGFEVWLEDGEPEEAAEAASQAPVAPVEAPEPAPAPAPCNPPAEEQEQDAGPEDEDAGDGDAPNLPDLAELKRPALLALVQELGLGLNVVGMKNVDLAVAVREEWRARGLIG